MNTNKQLTVIIPSYNEEKYIGDTLAGIFRQDLPERLRVVVADGGSTDNTLKVVERASTVFKDKLEIEVIEGGKVARGRNNGAKVATTPYLLFMDADSVLLQEDIIKKTLEHRKEYDIVTCKQRSTVSGDRRSDIVWRVFNLVRRVMPQTFCTGCYFFISKKQFKKLKGFDETLNNSEDFWLSRNIKKSKFKILDRYVGQDDRRFKKMGYWTFLKFVLLNYWYRNDIEWFRKDIGYWEPYK